MELFYLKDSPFDCKSTQKRPKILNAPKQILTTNPYTNETKQLRSLKYITNQISSPRIFSKKKLTENPENNEKLSRVQQALEKLSHLKSLIIKYQGESDELLSRITGKKEYFQEISNTNEEIKNELSIKSQILAKEVDSLKENIENSRNSENELILKIGSEHNLAQKLKLEIESETTSISTLIKQQSFLSSRFLEKQQEIRNYIDRLENRKSHIQLLIKNSNKMHKIYQEDIDTKVKVIEQIEKFKQIRNI